MLKAPRTIANLFIEKNTDTLIVGSSIGCSQEAITAERMIKRSYRFSVGYSNASLHIDTYSRKRPTRPKYPVWVGIEYKPTDK
jgi:hypothetical protein